MEELEKRIKELEIQEKRLKNKTFWLSALIPIITIVVSLLTTIITINSKYGLDELDFTQEQITALLENDDIVDTRKKLKFLISSNLIGSNDKTNSYLLALDENLVDKSEGMKYFLKGVSYYNEAFYSPKERKQDSVYMLFANAVEMFNRSIELDPLNPDAIGYLASSYHNLGGDTGLNSFNRRALEKYNQAIALDSTLNYLVADRAKVHDLIGNVTKACNDAKDALMDVYLDSLRQKDMKNILKNRKCE